MRQRVGNRQQQAVGRRQRRRQAACSHHAGDHIGQAADFGSGQHDDVTANLHLTQLQQAVLVDIDQRQQRRINRGPLRDPGWQLVKWRSHQHREDLVLDENGQRGCREVQQENEEQGPGDRAARLLDRWRGVVTHQDVRQCSRADHQAKHQCHEVAARDVEGFLGFGVAIGVASVLGGMAWHAAKRFGTGFVVSFALGPGLLGTLFVLGQGGQGFLGGGNLGHRAIGSFQVGQLLGGGFGVGGHGGLDVLELFAKPIGPGLEGGNHFLLLGIVDQHFFLGTDLLKLVTVHQLGNWHTGLLDRQPDHRDQVGHDQDDVLGHLGPGDGAHATEERAHQNTAQAQKDAQLEGHAREAGGDQTDAINLRHHIGEGAQDGGKDADQPWQVAVITRAQEVGNGELPELAQVGREKQRHQAVAAGPAHDEGQPAIAGEVQGTGHADEGRRRHPVRPGGHAVVHGRDATPRHVILGRVVGSAHDADAGIQQHRGREKDVTDPVAGQAHLLQHRQHDHKGQEAPDVPAVDLVQLRLEGRVAGGAENAAGLFVGHACHVNPPQLRPRHAPGRVCSCNGRSTR